MTGLDKHSRLEGLNQRIRTCRSCELWKTRTHPIIGEGNPNSVLMIIAQAPGYREDEEGRMFIGPSGRKLDELLEHAQIRRKNVYMTNLVKCVLPHNRKPKLREIRVCSQYLDEEINIVEPEVISTLGYHPAKYIFEKYGLTEKLDYSEICGITFKADARTIYPLRHPATLLYNLRKEAEIKENYRRLKTFLEEHTSLKHEKTWH